MLGVDKIAVSDAIVGEHSMAAAIDRLRDNLTFCTERARAIGVTSFGAAAGRTEIAFQLAASLARNKKSVLLIDADLRGRGLQTRLGVDGAIDGLSQYLTGRAEMDAVVKKTDVPGLFVMFAGSGAGSDAGKPAELLAGERFQALIPQLKAVLDYILVDTPSMEQAIDCAAAAPALDGVLVAVDAANSSGRRQRRIKKRLEGSGTRILGVVLEGAESKVRISDAGVRIRRLLRPLEGSGQ